jgi:hypothetical protein
MLSGEGKGGPGLTKLELLLAFRWIRHPSIHHPLYKCML